MEKRTYIQPEMEMMVIPAGVMMQDPAPASGGEFPNLFPANPAPKKRPF